jgi:hypothetical protein
MNWQRMRIHSNHRHLGVAAAAALLLNFASAAHALDAIVLEVRELTVGGIPVSGASVRLDLLSDKQTRPTVTARAATLPDPMGKISDFSLVCERPVIAEPRYGCDAGRLTGRGGPTGALDMTIVAQQRTDTGITTFSGKGLKVMGTTAAFDGRMDANGWQVKGSTVRPRSWHFAQVCRAVVATARGYHRRCKEVSSTAPSPSRAPECSRMSRRSWMAWISPTRRARSLPKVRGSARFRATRCARYHRRRDGYRASGSGAPSTRLFDFGGNPRARRPRHLRQLLFRSTHCTFRRLICRADGSGSLNLAGDAALVSGHFKLRMINFRRRTSYMQITLAASVLGDADHR